jgi:sulfide dehydrogenase cytochrome subunit
MNKTVIAAIGASLIASTGFARSDEASNALSWNCNGCHGFEGASAGPLIPSIAGMNMRLLFYMMRSYQRDERPSTIMGRIAKGYSALELRRIAEYFAARSWQDAPPPPLTETQMRIAQARHQDGCGECHEDDGRYQDKDVPRLAGQLPRYLAMQLRDYRDPSKELPQPSKMRDQVESLTDEEVTALSLFYAQIRSR